MAKKNRKTLPPRKPKNLSVRSREYLTPKETQELRDAAKDIGRHGFRDWLLIMMMYRHALRVGEIVELCWEQIHLTSGKFSVERIKNGEPSIHYLENDEIRALQKLKEDQTSQFVFSSERGGPLTTRTIHHIISRAGTAAGFKFPVHSHMLRHSKGYQLVSKGVDIQTIQNYMGHKNIQNTILYTKPDLRDFIHSFKGLGRD